jgi:hypothetical protein
VFQRKTQSANYWGEGLRFTADDVAYLAEAVLDEGRPFGTDELVLALIEHRCRQEEAEIREELAKGALYQPSDDFEIGQRLVFPAFDFAVATVVDKRAGINPEHGVFNVIKVKFEGRRKLREFAAALDTPHDLNVDDGGDSLLDGEGLLTPAALRDNVAGDLDQRLAGYLRSLAEGDFVEVGGEWLLADMQAEVNVGHLNIAEALVEMAGRPMPSQQLLEEFDLPAEVVPEIALFSVNRALEEDARFDNIGVAGKSLWYLRRLEPEAAVEVPEALRYAPLSYDRSALSAPLLRLEWELGDEWSEEVAEPAPPAAPTATVPLLHPHRRAGTLPLSFRTAGLFPSDDSLRSMVTMVDGRWGQRFTGWVVHDGRYVVGLGDWFDQHKVPVGAYIVLGRGQQDGEVVVDIRPRRMRREWARMARVEDDNLVFEMRKMPIACEYDEFMVVEAVDVEALDELRHSPRWADLDLPELIDVVFPELLKLSPDGTVHAKTVYSALNMVRRLPPGPVFAALLGNSAYLSAGDGFWAAK